MDNDEFRRFGHALIDWVADYRAQLDAKPVMSRVAPGDVKAALPEAPPERGRGLAQAIEALDTTVVPGITHWNHPAFFAYFPSNTSYASVLADLVAAGLGAQGMSWQTSPAATELEQVMLDWLRQLLGLSSAWTGVIQDTASTATFCALVCARERASGFAQAREGLQGSAAPLIVYTSEQAHSSVEKAARLAGYGEANVRRIATDAAYAMRLDALEEAMAADVRAGSTPCAIVATVGTTVSTANDPVEGAATIAAAHGAWLHVDAAMAGSAMIVPECRWMWNGIEHADSLVLNPHKWLGAGFDLSTYYVRDTQLLQRAMATSPSYLRTERDDVVTNFRDWGVALGRRFRALKLWFVLCDEGAEGLRTRLRRDLANAAWLVARIDDAPDWERLAPTSLQTLCIRHVPNGEHDETALDAHNLELARRINEGGQAYVTTAELRGRRVIRVSIGAEATELRHVEALWRNLREAAFR